MKSAENQSLGNISRDSGVLVMDKSSRTHSRNTSTATATSYLYHDIGERKRARSGGYFKSHYKSFLILIPILLSLVALLSYAYLPLLLKRILQSIINIKPGGEFYDFWIESSEPTEVGIFFFHVENPWAVENGLENIRVRETGKYVFKQRFVREIANFTNNNSLVNFIERRYFIFDEEKTNVSLDENITVVNVPFAALSSIVPHYVEDMTNIPFLSSFNLFNQISYRSINNFLESHSQELFVNTTVRQLLYGYRLDILDTAQSYSGLFSKFGFDIMPTKLFPNNSFGILNGRNGTPDGPYEMYTGLEGTGDQFGYFKTWNSKKKLDFWKGNSCNAINGTDGTIWPAGVNKNDRLYFFIPDVCRSLYVTFQEESQFKGIPTYIFSAPDEVLAGSRTNPDNECFCLEEDEELIESRCTLDGIFDLGGCQNGIPLIVTLPHFLGADKRITEKIEGLKPDAEKHRPVLHIEPTMGTVIHGDSRLQMAIRVPGNQNLKGFEKIKGDLYIPIFWGYKKLGMSDEMAKDLKLRLFVPVKIANLVLMFLFFAGLFSSCCAFFWLLYKKNRSLMQILTTDYESDKVNENYTHLKCDEEERMIPRVDSATSDLGDNKSEENSFQESLPSTTMLDHLVNSAETDI